MEKKFIPIRYDRIFRDVFSHEGILRRLISDVTGIPLERIKSVRLTTPFLWRWYSFQKLGIMDIAAILNDDTRIDVELQIRTQKFWLKRTLFYLAKMYTEDLKIGQNYNKLRRCIVISILDFNLIPGEDYHTSYTLRDEEGNELTDLFTVHFVELKKGLGLHPELDDWVELFRAETREEMDAVKTDKKEVLEAMEVVRTMNLSRTVRALYEAHLKAARDRWAEDEYVRQEGMEAGLALGREESREALEKAQTEFRERLDKKDQELNQKDQELNQKNQELNQKDQELNQKDQELAALREELARLRRPE